MQTVRLWAGDTLLLDVVAVARPAMGPSTMRPGTVHDTQEGPWVQYGPAADSPVPVEVEIPYATASVIEVVRQIAAGAHGDVFMLETPRETLPRAALLPGRDGVAIEIWPGDPAAPAARVIMRFVRV